MAVEKLLLESGGDYLSLDTGTDDLLLQINLEIPVSDTLPLSDLISSDRVINQSISDNINFVEVTGQQQSIEDTLVLSELLSLNIVSNRSLSDNLNLIETIDSDFVFNRSASDQFDIFEDIFGIVLNEKTYVILQAPFDFIQTTLVLPNPLFDDTENLVHSVNLKRSMNGETYTYVKSSPNRILKYTFTLPREKGLALEDFCRSYQSAPIKLTNWKGEVWNVNIMTNAIDFVETNRYFPTSDRTDVNLEFEGTRVY